MTSLLDNIIPPSTIAGGSQSPVWTHIWSSWCLAGRLCAEWGRSPSRFDSSPGIPVGSRRIFGRSIMHMAQARAGTAPRRSRVPRQSSLRPRRRRM